MRNLFYFSPSFLSFYSFGDEYLSPLLSRSHVFALFCFDINVSVFVFNTRLFMCQHNYMHLISLLSGIVQGKNNARVMKDYNE